MARSPDSPFDLSQSLSDELGQADRSDAAEAARELEEVIAEAPERTEFRDTKKFLVGGPLASLVCLAVAFGLLGQPEVHQGVPMFLVGLGLFGFAVAYQHRNDGNAVIATLTRTHLEAGNLSGPLALVEVTGVEVVHATQVYLNLHVGPDAPLPTATKLRGLLRSQAVVFPKGKGRRVVVALVGIRVDGKTLDGDDALALIERHLAAAHATRELEALHAAQS